MAEDEFEPTVAASVEPIKILDEELSVEEVVDDIHNRFSQMTFDQLITKLREAEEMSTLSAF